MQKSGWVNMNTTKIIFITKKEGNHKILRNNYKYAKKLYLNSSFTLQLGLQSCLTVILFHINSLSHLWQDLFKTFSTILSLIPFYLPIPTFEYIASYFPDKPKTASKEFPLLPLLVSYAVKDQISHICSGSPIIPEVTNNFWY